MYVTPKIEYTVKDGEVIAGKCAGETVTLSGCQLPKCLQEPKPVVWDCSDIEPSEEVAKLCEILEAIQDLEIDLPEAAGVTKLGCVREDPANPKSAVIGCVLVCKIEDADTGEISYKNVMVPVDGGEIVDPYEGPFDTNCGPAVYNKLSLWIDDPQHPLCGHCIYECDGKKYAYNPETCQYELLPEMIKVTTNNAGNLEKVCETLDIPIEITEATTGTAADLIALALAEGLAFPTYGDPVAEDVIAITGQAAGPITYAGQTGDCIEDTEGVSGTTEFDFAADCLPVNLNVCLRKCLTAAEVKALSGEK